MNRYILATLGVWAGLVSVSSASAQQASPGDRAWPADRDPLLRRETRALRPAIERRLEPYEADSDVYVVPSPYNPEYSQPRVRPYEYEIRRYPQGYGYTEGYHRPRYYDVPRWRNEYDRRYRRGPSYYHDDRRDWNRPHFGYRGGYVPYAGELDRAYALGRYDANRDYVRQIALERAGRLLNQWRWQFDEAIIMFRDGSYDRAAINMLGAAEKNHADAASRLHAGHALFALGRYKEAVELLARAFELSPSLAYKSYDIRDEYGNKADFDEHLESLRAYVAERRDEAAAVTLLGYVTFYSEGPGAAYPYLQRAATLDQKSYFIPKLLPLARFGTGMAHPPNGSREKTEMPQRKTFKGDSASRDRSSYSVSAAAGR
ncbi:MAG: hypothetical protein ABII12_05965 [Planctomycetota bacterium]